MHRGILRILSARRGLTVFLGGVVCLATWQVWLTWRLVEQDRSLELQRSRERLGEVADLTIAQLAGTLSEWACSLKLIDALPPPSFIRQDLPNGGTLVLIALEASIDKENVDGDLKSAMEIYQKLAADLSATREVRANALLRLASCEENLGKQAKQVYEQILREYGDQPRSGSSFRGMQGWNRYSQS